MVLEIRKMCKFLCNKLFNVAGMLNLQGFFTNNVTLNK